MNKGPLLLSSEWTQDWSLKHMWTDLFDHALNTSNHSEVQEKREEWSCISELPLKVGTYHSPVLSKGEASENKEEEGEPVELSLKDYLHYVVRDSFGDTEPLFVFDDDLHLKLPSISDHYIPPLSWTTLGVRLNIIMPIYQCQEPLISNSR